MWFSVVFCFSRNEYKCLPDSTSESSVNQLLIQPNGSGRYQQYGHFNVSSMSRSYFDSYSSGYNATVLVSTITRCMTFDMFFGA